MYERHKVVLHEQHVIFWELIDEVVLLLSFFDQGCSVETDSPTHISFTGLVNKFKSCVSECLHELGCFSVDFDFVLLKGASQGMILLDSIEFAFDVVGDIKCPQLLKCIKEVLVRSIEPSVETS